VPWLIRNLNRSVLPDINDTRTVLPPDLAGELEEIERQQAAIGRRLGLAAGKDR
jgi:hypothetical protein